MAVMEMFTVNGKSYQAKDVSFDYLVFLDINHIQVNDISGLAAINAFFAFCTGLSMKKASDEITSHVINNNGQMPQELIDVYGKMPNDSDFFRALLQGDEKTEDEMDETNAESSSKKKRVAKKVTE